ncbi:Papain-like cysteine peptidase superfamily [Sesbania bispinosa]|nr:Papain-like cysteine peptidase superfamily [Sesbania bispinosa]
MAVVNEGKISSVLTEEKTVEGVGETPTKANECIEEKLNENAPQVQNQMYLDLATNIKTLVTTMYVMSEDIKGLTSRVSDVENDIEHVSEEEDSFEQLLRDTPKSKRRSPSTPKIINFAKTKHDMYYGSAGEKSLSILAICENQVQTLKGDAIKLSVGESCSLCLSSGGGTGALYRLGESTLTRKDMPCMPDPNEISVEIIRLLALQFTVTERKSGTHSFWMLPPSFVRDVQVGTTLDDVLETYANDWMPPYVGLKYIYVPVQEVTSQWFLIVVSISDIVVYHLDSFLDDKLAYGRRITIEKVCKVLSQCITSDYYPTRFFKHLGNMQDWDIKEPDNNPYVPYGENYAVWVLEWMHMRDAFGIEIMATKAARNYITLEERNDILWVSLLLEEAAE